MVVDNCDLNCFQLYFVCSQSIMESCSRKLISNLSQKRFGFFTSSVILRYARMAHHFTDRGFRDSPFCFCENRGEKTRGLLLATCHDLFPTGEFFVDSTFLSGGDARKAFCLPVSPCHSMGFHFPQYCSRYLQKKVVSIVEQIYPGVSSDSSPPSIVVKVGSCLSASKII